MDRGTRRATICGVSKSSHKLKMKSEAAGVDVEAAASYPEDLTKVIN